MDFRTVTLIRRLHLSIRADLIAQLKDQGYDDITPAHIYVFQTPGPDGRRPTELAQGALLTKQAMNHLLSGLEGRGYLERVPADGDGRARVLRLTSKGRDLTKLIQERSAAIERRWGAELGPEVLEEVRTALQRLDEIDVPGADARRSSLGQTVRRGHRSTLIER